MPAFKIPADIGNRALQHCGQPRMDAVLGFSDPSSRGAAELFACYDKMREAELRQRFWSFAIRRTVLRANDNNNALQWAAGGIIPIRARGNWRLHPSVLGISHANCA
jgi:hypothetical protein